MANKIIAATLVLCALLLCTAFAQQATKIPNAVEEPRMLPSVLGRYQAMGLSSNQNFILVDTQTGQCWMKSPTGPWQDQGSPVKAKE